MPDQRPLYPVDAWRIRELTFDPVYAARERDDLLAGQRAPGPAREPRGGGRQRRPRDVRERVLRGGPDRVRRDRLWLPEEPPGPAQRRRREADPAPRRRRSVRPRDRDRGGVRAVTGPADRGADALHALAGARRRRRRDRRPPARLADAAQHLGDRLRGDDGRGRGAPAHRLRDQRAGAQPGGVRRPARGRTPPRGRPPHRASRGVRDLGRGRPADPDHAPRAGCGR